MACQEELATNVFLRCEEAGLARWCGMPGAAPVAVLAELRRRKDHATLPSSLISYAIDLVTLFQPLARYFGLAD